MSAFSKITEDKVNVQKSILILFSSNKKLETQIYKTVIYNHATK